MVQQRLQIPLDEALHLGRVIDSYSAKTLVRGRRRIEAVKDILLEVLVYIKHTMMFLMGSSV